MSSLHARLFGGIFSTLEEYAMSTSLGGTVNSPMYSKATEMLDKYLESGFDSRCLDSEVVNWINSPVLDDLQEDYSLEGMCKKGHVEMAKWMMERNPVSKTYYHGVLSSICEGGNIELMEWFLEEYPEIEAVFDADSCVYLCCARGQFELAEWLTDRIGSSGSADSSGSAGSAGGVARINMKDYNFHRNRFACQYGRLDVLLDFLQIYPKNDMLCEGQLFFNTACEFGHLEIVKWFVENYSVKIEMNNYYALRLAQDNHRNEVSEWIVQKYDLRNRFMRILAEDYGISWNN